MKIQLTTLIFLIFCTFAVFAQNVETDNSLHKITLNTGEVFFGEILVENEQIVMIRTADGSRFQFPRSEVQSIEMEVVIITEHEQRPLIATDFTSRNNNTTFAMMVDAHGGISRAPQAFSQVPVLQGALVLGVQNILLQNTFLGGGIGYTMLFPSDDYFADETMTFLPLFVRFQKIIGDSRLVPYVEMDAGYGFSLHSDFGGGAMLRLSVGMKITSDNTFYIGVFAGLQNFSGQLTQTTEFGTFSFHGNSTIQSLGMKLGVKF